MRNCIQLSEFNSISQMDSTLGATIADLNSWIRQVGELGVPHFGELGDRLRPLYDQLDEHFQQEEETDYLSTAIAHAPQLAHEADDLLLQHAQFLERLETLICRLHASDPKFPSWQQACRELNKFLKDLNHHQHHEQALLHAARKEEIAMID